MIGRKIYVQESSGILFKRIRQSKLSGITYIKPLFRSDKHSFSYNEKGEIPIFTITFNSFFKRRIDWSKRLYWWMYFLLVLPVTSILGLVSGLLMLIPVIFLSIYISEEILNEN